MQFDFHTNKAIDIILHTQTGNKNYTIQTELLLDFFWFDWNRPYLEDTDNTSACNQGYENKLAIGKVEWRRTINHKTRIGKVPTKLVCIDNEKYRTYNKPFFITGVLILIVYLVLFLINLIS